MAIFLRGRLLELDGNLVEAAAAYDAAAELDPDSADLQRHLAQVRVRLGETEVALAHAERAFELTTSRRQRQAPHGQRRTRYLHQRSPLLAQLHVSSPSFSGRTHARYSMNSGSMHQSRR